MNTIGRRILSVAGMVLLLSTQCPSVLAHEECVDAQCADKCAAEAGSMNLNLRSRERVVTAGQHHDFDSATLQVGRTSRTVTASDLLTHAEHVALQQVLATGQQSLVLGRHGNAVRGSFNLTPDISQGVHDVIVPRGVTAVADAASAALNITGNLINAGRLYAITSDPQTSLATISAASIHNRQGAIISSILPGAGLAGVTSAVSHLDLSLNAVHDIINHGMISSSGNLSLSAGGQIVNALPAGASGAAPVMQALGNVNLASSSIVNAGLIASITGSINIASQMANNLLVQNTGGTLQALSGAINIGAPSITDKINLTVLGGDLLSRELNAFSGKGKVLFNVEDITGLVNVYAHEAHIAAATDNLRLGTIALTGDPTFFNLNPGGDVTISGPGSSIQTNGAALAIVASHDINIESGATLDTTGNGTAGNILLIAGVDGTPVTFDSNDQVTILTLNGPSATGGNINITGGSQLEANDSTQAGQISLFAFSGTSGGRGNVVIDDTSGIAAHSTAAGKNGQVNITAAGTSTGIQVSSIDTELSGTGGSITINAANPTITPTLQIQDGAIISGSIDVGTLTNGNIHTTGALFSGGAIVLKTDDGDIEMDLNVIGHTIVVDSGAQGTITVEGILAGTGSKAQGDEIRLLAGTLTIAAGGQVRSGNQVVTDVPILLGANNITNNGSVSSGDELRISHFFDQDPVIINVTVSGSGTLSAATLVEFAFGVDNLRVSQQSITGNIDVPLFTHTIDFAVANGGLTFTSALDTDHAAGSSISLDAQTGNIVALTLDASGSQGAPGGTITVNADNLFVTQVLSNLASIDASSPADGNGGTVNITTNSGNVFVVGNAPGPNGTAGDILADGGNNGGSITLNNAGGQTVNTTVSASGKSGKGGSVFLGGSPNLNVLVNGSILATNNANSSGTIAISAGANGTVNVNGNGTIQAGKVVKVGNVNPNNLKFASPPANSVNIDPNLTIGNKIDFGGGAPVLVALATVPPGSLAGLPSAPPPPQQQQTAGGPVVQRVATDQTPVNEGSNYSLASKLPSVSPVALSQVIVATQVDTDNFDASLVSALTSQGALIGGQTAGNYMELEKGNMLFTPQHDITVKIVEGYVFIAGGSQVLIMETGIDQTGFDPTRGESAVYDLHDLYKGAVRVVAGKKEIVLTPGKQVVLTKKLDAKFEDVNPGLKIAYRNVRSEEVGGGIKAFAAEFSIPSAMTRVDPLRRYLASKQGKNRAVANQLLKNAVLMANMGGGAEPYKSGQ